MARWPQELTKEQVAAKLAELPEFSRSVYDTIHKHLYAEPGFSDVTAEDVAKELKTTPQAVGGALTHLGELGLVDCEPYDANGVHHVFLHTIEHALEL